MPQLGEVIFGRRRQMSQNPIVPWSDIDLVSDVARLTTKNGNSSTIVRHKRKAIFRPTWEYTGSDIYGLDDGATLNTWFDTDTLGGTRRTIFCPTPNASPQKSYWCDIAGAEKRHPIVMNPAKRSASYELIEVAPFFANE